MVYSCKTMAKKCKCAARANFFFWLIRSIDFVAVLISVAF